MGVVTFAEGQAEGRLRKIGSHDSATTVRAVLPDQLYVASRTWDFWQGSPARIAQIARVAEKWMHWRWGNVPAYSLSGTNSLTWSVDRRKRLDLRALRWRFRPFSWRSKGPYSLEDLANELAARRTRVSNVRIENFATPAEVPNTVFDCVRLVTLSDKPTPTNHSVTGPARATITFSTGPPAVAMTAIARHPYDCWELLEDLTDHINAGVPPLILKQWLFGTLGIGLAAGIAVGMGLAGWITPSLASIIAMALGGPSWLALRRFGEWTFPNLELLETWERSRWQRVRAAAFQALTLALALGGILTAVLLAAPSK